MSWPPDKKGWAEILDQLPAAADRAKARNEIEAVVTDYGALGDDEAARQHEHWRELEKSTSSKNFELLCRSATRVGPDRLAPNNPEWPSRLVDDLVQAGARARTRVLYFRPCGKRHRFDLGLCLVWIYNGGGRLPNSDEGPFVRFFRETANKVLPDEVTRREVKHIADRERRRVAFLFPSSLATSSPVIGTPSMKIN